MAPRRPNQTELERIQIPYDHASVTADTTVKLWAPDRKFRVDRIWYVNPTGLAASATNYFDVQILKGSTVIANHSTKTGEEGALVADTPVVLAMTATEADQVLAAGDILTLKLDETGTATLPAGRIVVEGRYL